MITPKTNNPALSLLSVGLFSLILVNSCGSANTSNDPSQGQDKVQGDFSDKHPSLLPKAPLGYTWQKITAMSDEFNGDRLDTNKWRDHITTWQGRPPAEFLKSNVSVYDGSLALKTSTHPSPNARFTMGGAAVSGRQNATYGYFEARIKASRTKMSTTFWLHSDTQDDKHLGCGKSHSIELDILETIGGWPTDDWANWMRSNSHYKGSKLINGRCSNPSEEYRSQGVKHDTGEKLADNFNVFSMWWVTPNQMHFYYNGEKTGTVNLAHDNIPLPFDSEMSLRMVVETYSWQPKWIPDGQAPYPSDIELDDDTINTAFYDHVRSYELVPSKMNVLSNPDFENNQAWILNDYANYSDSGQHSFTHARGLLLRPGAKAEQEISINSAGEYSLLAHGKKLMSNGSEEAASVTVFDENGNALAELFINGSTFVEQTVKFRLEGPQKIKLVATNESVVANVVDTLAIVAQ
jgi:hypothetical protein